MFHALIMAGGSGTRLWPLSRKSRPKQSLSLIGERTMFQMTVDRLHPLIPLDNVHVVTNAVMAAIFREQVPDLPASNYIIEPNPRDSGPAAALGLAHISRIDPDAVVAILTADHHIGLEDEFRAVLQTAHDVALGGYIVTLGIDPSSPSTGFGYVEREDQLQGFTSAKHAVFRATRFTEKPSLDVAKAYLAGGRHSWNSGMFILTARTGLAEFARQQPEFAAQLEALRQAIGMPGYPDALAAAWESAPRKSLDYAIMEGARQIAVIPVSIDWSDIGSWASLLDVLEADESGNVILGDHNITIDTQDTFVRGGNRVIATIGVSDLIVIDTPDALLICTKDRVQEVKAVVDRLKGSQRDHVL